MYVSILEGGQSKGVGERRKESRKGGRRKDTRGGIEKKRATRKEDKWDGMGEGRRLLPCLPHIAVNNINQYPTTAQGLS